VEQTYTLRVNGSDRTATCLPETPLLWVLRGDLGLLGTRFGCGVGSCGACTVHLDGVPVHSCDTPIWSVGTKAVTTVEGLGTADAPHPVQRALIEHQAGQCGYCLSGIVMQAAALVDSGEAQSESSVRAALDGNLCRCGAHNRMVRAVLDACASVGAGTTAP
jgi:nicotinate dehydrogenase subunit A